MKLRDWLYDKKVYFLINTLLLIFLLIFLSVFGMNFASLVFITIIILMSHIAYLSYEYMRRFRFYKNSRSALDNLDQKYLINELMEEAQFLEGNWLLEILQESHKSMNDEIGRYKNEQRDYRDYIETWVHEIKTPLSAGKLIVQNNPNTVTNSLEEELTKIDAFVEQALYYARSNHLEKDYVLKSLTLESIVQSSLRKLSKSLIGKRCEIKSDNLAFSVLTDEKWIIFVLTQVINNSIKYSSKPMVLHFKGIIKEDFIKLSITDEGVGIPKEELPLVFKKGFVGNTGRMDRNSTGIGLYLCKKLCDKMGLSIVIKSELNNFTTVDIVFPKSSMYS